MAVSDNKVQSRHWALFKLRAKLTWRRFSQQKGQLVGVVIGLICILPLVLLAAGGSWFGYTSAPDQWPAQIFGLILVGLWAFWVVFPILATALGEGISVDQLLQYPLSVRDIVLGMTLGSLLDWQTYFAFPLFIAAVVGLGMKSLVLAPLVFVACIVGLGLMVVSSHLTLTVLGGILQSRRFRDVAVVLLSLSGFICWVGTQALGNVAETITSTFNISGEDAEQFFATFQPLDTLKWLPPGALGQSVASADSGSWGMALVWLLYAVAWLIALAWLWGKLVFRLTTGGGHLIQFKPRAEKPKAPPKKGWELGWLRGVLSAETHQIMLNEFRASWRVPQRRLVTLQAILMPLVIGGFSLVNAGGFGRTTASLPSFVTAIAIPLYVIFSFWISGQNMLGWEHRGLPSLLLTPVPRERIFRGKSIAIMIVNGLPLMIIALVFATLSGQPIAYLWAFMGMLAVLPIMAVQSIISTYFPFPVKLNYKANKSSFSSGGCIGAIVIMTILPFSIIMLSLPLVIPSLVYYLAASYRWVIIPLVPLLVAYAIGVWYFATAWAGSILIEREPEVIKAAQPIDAD